MYEDKNYKEVKRGRIDGYDHVILYVHNRDTNYTYHKIYFIDSTFRDSSFMKMFYFNNIPNGPFISYIDGQLSQKGTYKNGQIHGEKLRFQDGRLATRSFYLDGVKTGKWEVYDSTGKLVERTTYNEEGNLVKSENF
jgi:antitoxin component YwqK of YwqJK toxin-antitoxin module